MLEDSCLQYGLIPTRRLMTVKVQLKQNQDLDEEFDFTYAYTLQRHIMPMFGIEHGEEIKLDPSKY